MKRTFIIILFMVCFMQAWAQNTFIPDMTFPLNFSTVDGSSTNAEIWGQCGYYRFKRLPNSISGVILATNELEVYLEFPSLPQDAWIVEKNVDGTFTPVTEITNLFEYNYYDHYFYYSQNLSLTKKQILKMLNGGFYAKVGFGGSNYISNLSPENS